MKTYNDEEFREHVSRMITFKTLLKDVAEKHGVHPSYLSQVLTGAKEVSKNLAEKFGFERVFVKVKK